MAQVKICLELTRSGQTDKLVEVKFNQRFESRIHYFTSVNHPTSSFKNVDQNISGQGEWKSKINPKGIIPSWHLKQEVNKNGNILSLVEHSLHRHLMINPHRSRLIASANSFRYIT